MKKNCSRCLKRAKAQEAGYCSRCLAEVIEKRVKRKLSALAAGRGRPNSGKIALACNDRKSLQCSVAAYLIKKMAKLQTPVKSSLRRTAVVTAECADEIAADFIRRLTAWSGSKSTFSPESKAAAVNIFESTTEKELELYAGIKRIKYTKAKSMGIKRKIQELQARHPGTIEALAKSGRQIGGL